MIVYGVAIQFLNRFIFYGRLPLPFLCGFRVVSWRFLLSKNWCCADFFCSEFNSDGNSEYSSFFSLGPMKTTYPPVVQYEIHVLHDFIVAVTDLKMESLDFRERII